MEKFIGRIASISLLLLLLIFFMYQFINLLQSSYKIETIFEYTIQDSISTNGIMIRDEQIIDSDISDDVISYYYDDGTRIIKDEAIAKKHDNVNSADNEKKYNDIQSIIDILKECQRYSGTNLLKVDILNRQINESISNFIVNTSNNIYDNIGKIKLELMSNINKKQIISDKNINFNNKIHELEKKRDSLSFANSNNNIYSPYNGYFVSSIDGFENLIDTKSVSKLTVEKIKNLVNTSVKYENRIGKVISSNVWYYAAIIPSDFLQKFTVGKQVYLDFGITDFIEIPVNVERIISDNSNDGIVIFSGNYMSPQIAKMRISSVEINFNTYTGLRINKKAIHYHNNETYVYKILGNELNKVPVEILYHGLGYVICSSKFSENNKVVLFDEVIVEGVDLYDGKSIK